MIDFKKLKFVNLTFFKLIFYHLKSLLFLPLWFPDRENLLFVSASTHLLMNTSKFSLISRPLAPKPQFMLSITS